MLRAWPISLNIAAHSSGVVPSSSPAPKPGSYLSNWASQRSIASLINASRWTRSRSEAVGGCGGNIAWHTPDDLMPVADLEILRRDLAVYLTTILRIVNAPIYPFDYSAAVDEIRTTIEGYQLAAGDEIDLSSLVADLASLSVEIREWRRDSEARLRRTPADGAERRRVNAVLRQIARTLVPLNYARGRRRR